MHRDTTTTRRATAALLSATLLLGSACSSDDAAAPADGTIAVTATDYAFEGVPERIATGATLALTNSSAEELHELVAIRLPDDETRSVEELLALPPEEVAGFFPGMTAVIIAPPSQDGMVVEGSATFAEAGRYAFICAIPTGADPQEYMEKAAQSQGGPPDVAGGPPHFVHGMWAEVTVVAS